MAEGDPETRACWSGCAQGFVRALRRHGVEVTTVDVEPQGIGRYLALMKSFRLPIRKWKRQFQFGRAAWHAKSQLASMKLRSLTHRPVTIVQAGATFCIPQSVRDELDARYIVYADANVLFANSGQPYSAVSDLTQTAIEQIAERERRVYHTADRIWPWSDALSRSFQNDFSVPKTKLRTIYAGPGPVVESLPIGHGDESSTAVLFVGKDHRRKGLNLLLTAFAALRRELADAELHVVGVHQDAATPAIGVTFHGFLNQDHEEGRAKLAHLYRKARVFCMPSHYEPFGVVFLEAMLAGKPCVGADAWAMPEIIEHGKTGWLTPPADVAELKTILKAALLDPDRTAAMGRAGRARVLEHFTWDRVAERAVDDLRLLLK